MITIEHNGTILELANTHAFLEEKKDSILLEDMTEEQKVALNQCYNMIVSAITQASRILRG